jgi:hypothetical protein
MDTMGFNCKIILWICTFMLLMSIVIAATATVVPPPGSQPLPTSPGLNTLPTGPQPINWNDPNSFPQNFENDPQAAFKNNPTLAWEHLNKNPALFDNPKVAVQAFKSLNDKPALLETPNVAAQAFKKDSIKTVGVINKQPDLLKNKDILKEFETAALADKNVLTKHSKVKVSWFKQKKIRADPKVSIKNLVKIKQNNKDVLQITTNKATFVPEDFPWARVLSDGKLVFGGGTHTVEGDISVSRPNGKRTYNLNSGKMTITDDKNNNIEIKKGKVIFKNKDSKKEYKGSFSIKYQNGNRVVKGKFERYSFVRRPATSSFRVNIEGTIADNEKRDHRNLLLHGKTSLFVKRSANLYLGEDVSPGQGLSMEVDTKNWVNFVSQPGRDNQKYCVPKISCIVQTDGVWGNRQWKGRLAFVNIQDDTIHVESKDYFSHVEVIGKPKGTVTYSSTKEKRTTVKVGNDGRPKVIEGKISDLAVGRIDVLYNKEGSCKPNCKQVQHHWSSSKTKSDDVKKYFGSHTSFISCTVGENCEKKMAKNFGKVIGPQGKTPSTLIIVAGESAETPRSLEKWCKIKGCYIVPGNSVPLKTSAKSLVITGHHIPGSNYIWRDTPEARGTKDHAPLDALYVEGPNGDVSFDQLPKGNIERVAFSSCNTHNMPKLLQKKYPSIKIVEAYRGPAPDPEYKTNLISNIDESLERGKIKRKLASGRWSNLLTYFISPDGSNFVTDGVLCGDNYKTVKYPCNQYKSKTQIVS